VRRATLWVTAIGVAILLASGVALVATFDGTPRPDTFVGSRYRRYSRTRRRQSLRRRRYSGIDRVRGDGGDDTVSGGFGGIPDRRERVQGDGGNSTVSGQGDQRAI
jgi:hypothetical protein